MSRSDKCLELKIIKYALPIRNCKNKIYVKSFSSIFFINILEIMEEQSGRQKK